MRFFAAIIQHHPNPQHFCTSQTGATSEVDQTNNPQTDERTVRQIQLHKLVSKANTQADNDKLVRKPPTNWCDQQDNEADAQTGETIYRDQLISEATSETGATKTSLRTSVRHLATRLNLQL